MTVEQNPTIRLGLDLLRDQIARKKREVATTSRSNNSLNRLRRAAPIALIALLGAGGIAHVGDSSMSAYAKTQEDVPLDYEGFAQSIKDANQHPIGAGGYNERCHCGLSRLGVPYLRPGPSTGEGTVIGPVGYEDALEIALVVPVIEIQKLDVPLDAVASLPDTGAYVTAVQSPFKVINP